MRRTVGCRSPGKSSVDRMTNDRHDDRNHTVQRADQRPARSLFNLSSYLPTPGQRHAAAIVVVVCDVIVQHHYGTGHPQCVAPRPPARQV